MQISRIGKAVAELLHSQTFQEAEDVRNKNIDLLLPTEISETDRRLAQTVTALALRCFTGIVSIHSTGSDSRLRALLYAEAKKMGSVKRLDFAPHGTGPWRLAVGHPMAEAVSVDASGWTARINSFFTGKMPAAPPAITFAAACGMAKLFNRAIFDNDKHAFETWDFCLARLLTGQTESEYTHGQIELGRVGLLGAGAIGSAAGYVLSISNWSGNLQVIDFDNFEAPNLETCLMADIQDVNRPLRKALSLANAFQGHRIAAIERRCKVKAGDPLLQEKWDAFVCGVDNPETRIILDEVNARILLNAGLGATKRDAGWVLWSRHGQSERTLSSMYQNSPVQATKPGYVPEEFAEECSRQSYNGVSLALPFVALAGGSLLTAGLYHNAIGARTSTSFVQIDLLRKQQQMTLQ